MSSLYSRNYTEIKWLPIPEYKPQPIKRARSRLPGPMVISDTMDPVQSMLDGKMYTSKSRLRSTYRAAGCVEVGNDQKLAPPPRKSNRKEIEAAVGRAFSRVGLGG